MHARVQIVATSGSGDGTAPALAAAIEQRLQSRGHSAQTLALPDAGRLADWAQHCKGDFSHLVCVGGDATLNAAAGAAVRLGVPVVPVPSGFGNLFARVFGYTNEAEDVATLIEDGQIRRIDVGIGENGVFLAHRTYGLLDEVEQAVEDIRDGIESLTARHLAYYAGAMRILRGNHLPSLQVELDGKLIADDAVLVTAANVETFRGFLSLTPTASPVDGLLDLYVLPRTSPARIWLTLLKLWLRVPGRWTGQLLRRGRWVRVSERGRVREELLVLRRGLRLLLPSRAAHCADADLTGSPR